MKIAFDFDKVFVNHPPLMPDKVIEWFYKRSNGHLSYRIPGLLEQKLRIISHNVLFRPPIQENIKNLVGIAKKNNIDMYLVSGRFGFLKDKTKTWLEKYKFGKLFKDMYFNFDNEQPHIYKDRIIKTLKIQKYIDDDFDLLSYLANKNPDVMFYWLNGNTVDKRIYLKNIVPIKNLKEFEKNFID